MKGSLRKLSGWSSSDASNQPHEFLESEVTLDALSVEQVTRKEMQSHSDGCPGGSW